MVQLFGFTDKSSGGHHLPTVPTTTMKPEQVPAAAAPVYTGTRLAGRVGGTQCQRASGRGSSHSSLRLQL